MAKTWTDVAAAAKTCPFLQKLCDAVDAGLDPEQALLVTVLTLSGAVSDLQRIVEKHCAAMGVQ